jgi:hypothetical protein
VAVIGLKAKEDFLTVAMFLRILRLQKHYRKIFAAFARSVTLHHFHTLN